MRMTRSRISRETRDVKSAPPRRSVPQTAQNLGACRRCGGFLVDEHCMDLDIGESGRRFRLWAMRCVQCGDMIDETILRNRYIFPPTHQEDQSSAKGGCYASVHDAAATIRRFKAPLTIH